MTDIEYRAAAADIEVSKREVEGILVPWDVATRINERLVEGFRSGAFDRQFDRPQRIPFALGHLGFQDSLGGQRLGKVIELRNDTAGLWGRAKVSETRAGDELLELLRDGVYDSLSIGFRDLAPQAPDREGVTWRNSALLTELAVVPTGAYPGAMVTGVRSEACQHCGGTGAVEQHRAEQAALLAEYLRDLRAPGQ